jgi:hypothetical protein
MPIDGFNSVADYLKTSPAKGRRAICRARLTALASSLWCFAQVPVWRRGRILPSAVTNLVSKSVFL